ncbi:putative RNA polymerase II subunit B1 CTD phosphatase rpap2 isoform X2 [Hoplias malabaricus]
MCGYPVCPNKLTNVPTQQYKISTKTNKVYDITERKCFCSNFCYKASKTFEIQISKSPLWLRKEERPPDIKLLKKGDGGSSGLEVELAEKPVKESDIENPDPEGMERHRDLSGPSDSSDVEQDFVSSVVSGERPKARVHWGNLPKREEEGLHEEQSFAKDTRTAHPDLEKESCDETSIMSEACPEPIESHSFTDPVVEDTRKLLDQCALSEKTLSLVTPHGISTNASDEANLNTNPNPNISHVSMSKKSAAGLKNLLKNHKKTTFEAPPVTLSLLEGLRVTLMDWRTEDTMRFLCGPEYTTALCEKEEEEEELDEDDLEDVETSTETHPQPTAAAPDYETLRKETEILDLRVQEFYKGVCVLPEETVPEDTGTKAGDKDPPLPPVDSQAQRLIQKRIVVEKLSRSLQDIVGPLRLSMSEIINDINSLVRTFRFTNVNIIHKPPEWTLIAVVLLSVLTEVSPLLKESMDKASSVEYISSLMKELKLKDEDLQSLVRPFKPNRL